LLQKTFKATTITLPYPEDKMRFLTWAGHKIGHLSTTVDKAFCSGHP